MGEKKSWVYIKSKESAWVPAIQTHTDGKKATVTVPQYPNEQAMDSDGGRAAKKGVEETVDLKGYISNVLPLQNVDGSGQLLEFADMVELPYLHEVSSEVLFASVSQVLSFVGLSPLVSSACTWSSLAIRRCKLREDIF